MHLAYSYAKHLLVSTYSVRWQHKLVINSAYTAEWNTKSDAESIRKRWCWAHLFTSFLCILVPSNWESSDLDLVQISEKVKQSDDFVFVITNYVSLPLTITVTLTPRYTILLLPRACSQMMIVISSRMQKNWISGCKILTRQTNTNPNTQFHIPVA